MDKIRFIDFFGNQILNDKKNENFLIYLFLNNEDYIKLEPNEIKYVKTGILSYCSDCDIEFKESEEAKKSEIQIVNVDNKNIIKLNNKQEILLPIKNISNKKLFISKMNQDDLEAYYANPFIDKMFSNYFLASNPIISIKNTGNIDINVF